MTDNRENTDHEDYRAEVSTLITVEEGKKACNLFGVGFTAFQLLWLIGNVIVSIIIMAINESLIENSFILYLASYIPMLFIALPVLYKIIKRLEANVPSKRSMSISGFIATVMIMYALSLAGSLVGIGVNLILEEVFGISSSSAVVEMISSGQDILVNFIFAGITAPIVEELIFRKLLIDRTLKFGYGLSIVLSGLLFGLIHGNFQQFFYAFFLGMLFAYIYIKTGKLRYTIILHMLLNSTSVLISALYPSIAALETMEYNEMLQYLISAESKELIKIFILVLLVFAQYIFGIIGAILLVRKRKKLILEDHKAYGLREEAYPYGIKSSAIIFKSPGMLLCIIIFLGTFIFNML